MPQSFSQYQFLNCFAPLAMTMIFIGLLFMSLPAIAATSIPFTINPSENVTVTGTPRVAVDVGGVTRYANYTSGSGTNALTFTYAMVAGDVDLDGVTLTSPIDLNGGTMKDAAGNDATLTFTPPNTTNVKVNYPSLGMDFVADADGRYTLNGTAYNDLPSFLTATGGTFTRASIGTYFDSAGVLQTAASGVPRFDYDPITLQPKGILIEESRTNRILNSYFENWAGAHPDSWSNPGNNITKIVGVFGSNAMRITGPFSNSGNRISTPISGIIIPSTTYTLTVRVKLVSGSGTLNMAIDSWGTNAFVFSSASMSVGQYVTLSQTATSAAGTGSSGGLHTNNTSAVFDLDYIQLEQGSFPTSYIPTTTAVVTRATDNLIIPTGSWYNNSIGTYFADVQGASMSSTFGGIIGSNSSSQQSLFGQNASILVGADPFAMGSRVAGSSFKAAYSYQSSGLNLSVNGGSINTGGSQNPNSPTSIEILGYWQGQKTTGLIKKVKYYPAVVSNAQLQLLTQ